MESKKETELASDILHGAEEIAEFVFGDRKGRRKIYYLAECTRIPLFRIGSTLCARRTALIEWIASQERRMAGEKPVATERRSPKR